MVDSISIYLTGNTLSEIRLHSKKLDKMITELQAYYSITLSNLVHDHDTGKVTFDAKRSREGFEWNECTHLNLSQVHFLTDKKYQTSNSH